MSYLLLQEPNQCPSCRWLHNIPRLYGQCRHCGMWLFDSTNDFKKFEADNGWRIYWVWTGKIEGWKARDWFFLESKPLERELKLEKLPEDYGQQSFIDRKLADSRKELKAELKKRKKKPVSVRVK